VQDGISLGIKLLKSTTSALTVVMETWKSPSVKLFQTVLRVEAATKAVNRIPSLGYCGKYLSIPGYPHYLIHDKLSAANASLNIVKENLCLGLVLGGLLGVVPNGAGTLDTSIESVSVGPPIADECNMDITTEECVHHDPPLTPDPADGVIADLIWSQGVERLISTGAGWEAHVSSGAEPSDIEWTESDVTEISSSEAWIEPPEPRASEFGDKIHVVTFSRCGHQLQDALHKGTELEEVRAAAMAAGHVCRLASGASVFVYPNQYSSIL